MIEKQNQKNFWNEKIKPRFHEKALNHQVKLLNGKLVTYANLDNAATTTPFLKVKEEIIKELIEYGSVHRGSGDKSKISTEKYEKTRETVKKFVNAKSNHYAIFTPNTTVGMNQLAYFFAHIKGKILVSDIEHSSSYLPWIFQEGRHEINERVTLTEALECKTEHLNKKIMEKGKNKLITYKTKPDFSFDLEDIEKIFKEHEYIGGEERIKLLVVTGASNVTGYKPPLKELSKIAHKYGAMVIVDACQLLQHEKIDMQEQEVDFVVFSGHKMYAPFGSGAIVGDKKILDAFWPYQMGGGNFPYITKNKEVLRYKNEQAHDPGTPNYAGARALHHAIENLQEIGLNNIAEHEHILTNYTYNELKKIENVELHVPKNKEETFNRSLITFNIKDIPPILVAEILNLEHGIGTRAGSYCVYEFSRKINATTHDEDRKITEEVKNGITANIPGSVRASFGMYNTIEDVNRLVLAIKEITEKGFEHYKQKYNMDEKTGEWRPINNYSSSFSNIH